MFMGARKLTAAALAAGMVMVLLAGCGSSTNNRSAAPASSITTEVVKKDPVTITAFAMKSQIDQRMNQQKIDFEKANPDIKVEFNILPGEGQEALEKQDIALVSGDKTDIICMPNPNNSSKYASGKLLLALNSVSKDSGYDMDKVFGKYLNKFDGDKVYYLPNELSENIVFYNKKIFDDAKVPYPTGDWTWDQYIGIAKKLTDPSKGIYGSLMELDWEYYNYVLANQRKIAWYKADGTSNFDDPAFKDSLKWVGELSAVHKIQPSLPEFKAEKLQYDSFMSGRFGMEMIGSWFMSVAQDYTKYPRDWEIGVCAPPTPADGKNVLGSCGVYGISATSAHQQEAFKFLTYICENSYKLSGGLPARVDISKDEMMEFFKDTSDKLKGEVTAEDLYKTFYNSNLGMGSEKIVGTASAQINNTYAKEAEKYLFGTQSLEDTMKNIKTKADEFIKVETE
jgi:multiple sugar transport system substrate-binding protein